MTFYDLPDLTIADKARFFAKMLRKGEDECWEWQANTDTRYGKMSLKGREYKAHRIAYYIFNGTKPRTDMDICHKCDNTLCVNPNHLFEGTRLENLHDCIQKGRWGVRVQRKGDDAPDCKIPDAAIDLMKRIYGTGFFSGRDVTKWFGVARSFTHRVTRGRQRGSEGVPSTRQYDFNRLCRYLGDNTNYTLSRSRKFRGKIDVYQDGVYVHSLWTIQALRDYFGLSKATVDNYAHQWTLLNVLNVVPVGDLQMQMEAEIKRIVETR